MKIGIFGSKYQKEKQSVIRRVFEKLKSLGAEIYPDSAFYKYICEEFDYHPDINDVITYSVDHIDLALSIGGDGTFLRTAAVIGSRNIPILGINTGRLGFLADISSNEIEETLEEIFKNYYRIEERTLLCLKTEERRYRGYNCALNEVAVLKRDTSSMITIHTMLDDEYLTSYQADGLVIATPTGSTAYSMSVNGPIIVPQNNSLALSPVAPHSLNVRPLVIPDNCKIDLHIESRNKTFLVSLDGRSEIFPADIKLSICKADYTAKVLKRYNHTFYKTLREKLMWGADARIK